MKTDKEKIKAFCEKNKTLLILVAISMVMLVLFLYLLLFTTNEEQINDNLERQELQTSSNEYAMENPFVLNKQEQNTSIQNPPSLKEDNQSLNPLTSNEEALVLEENETKIPDISQSSYAQSTQQDAIKEIQKKQKPADMVEFLNSIKDKIQLRKASFKYDLKEYKVGDSFLDFYEIEELGENYIRFKDENYSYNLRWIGEDNE